MKFLFKSFTGLMMSAVFSICWATQPVPLSLAVYQGNDGDVIVLYKTKKTGTLLGMDDVIATSVTSPISEVETVGNPGSIAFNDSPVILFDASLNELRRTLEMPESEASEKLKAIWPDWSVDEDIIIDHVVVGIAGYDFNKDKPYKGDDKKEEGTLKKIYFPQAFHEKLKKHHFSAKQLPDFYGDQVPLIKAARQVGRLADPEVTEYGQLHFIQQTTCAVGYIVNQQKEDSHSPENAKDGGYYQMGKLALPLFVKVPSDCTPVKSLPGAFLQTLQRQLPLNTAYFEAKNKDLLVRWKNTDKFFNERGRAVIWWLLNSQKPDTMADPTWAEVKNHMDPLLYAPIYESISLLKRMNDKSPEMQNTPVVIMGEFLFDDLVRQRYQALLKERDTGDTLHRARLISRDEFMQVLATAANDLASRKDKTEL